jgi:hypothetical protein
LETRHKGLVLRLALILIITLYPMLQIGASANGLPPIADAGGPYTGYESSNITFDASESYDPEGDELWYNWDFDDDGWPDLREWLNTSTITWIWYDDYFGNVTVYVTDWYDEVTDTTTVTVDNVAPTTDLSAVIQNYSVSFDDIATDPGSDDIKFTWDFGDSTTSVTTMYYNDGIGPDPYPSADEYNPMDITDSQIHNYSNTGIFNVTITVEDDDGGITIENMTIQINGSSQPKDQCKNKTHWCCWCKHYHPKSWHWCKQSHHKSCHWCQHYYFKSWSRFCHYKCKNW